MFNSFIKTLKHTVVASSIAFISISAFAESPDTALRTSAEAFFQQAKTDPAILAGNQQKIRQLVETKVMPLVNFQRMTALAVGNNWSKASEEQKSQIMAEFKTLLIRTYSGAFSELKDKTLEVKPTKVDDSATKAIVKSTISGKNKSVNVDYRVEKSGDSWKIYDFNVEGIWLVENYRNTFTNEIGKSGIDGLIKSLQEKNKANSK